MYIRIRTLVGQSSNVYSYQDLGGLVFQCIYVLGPWWASLPMYIRIKTLVGQSSNVYITYQDLGGLFFQCIYYVLGPWWASLPMYILRIRTLVGQSSNVYITYQEHRLRLGFYDVLIKFLNCSDGVTFFCFSLCNWQHTMLLLSFYPGHRCECHVSGPKNPDSVFAKLL